jgi:hypothetical protein
MTNKDFGIPVGFTGTRHGCTSLQLATLESVLALIAHRAEKPIQFHHGACVGSDEQASGIAMKYGYFVTAHPPSSHALISPQAMRASSYIMEAAPYLSRNNNIVRASLTLIATPYEPAMPASLRGKGTWTTVKYGENLGRRIFIIYPNGVMKEHIYT